MRFAAVRAVLGCTVAWVTLGSLAASPADATPAWLAPVGISEEHQGAYSDQVASDPRGDAVAVWQQALAGSSDIVQAAFRPAGGAWQPSVDLSEPGRAAERPQVALDAHGDAVAVWQRYNGSDYVIQAAFKSDEGGWQGPVDLSEAGEDAYRPEVAVDPGGDAVAVWERGKVVQAAFRPMGGSWQAPVDLSEEAYSAYVHAREPQVAFDSRGDAVAVWLRDNNGSNEIVQAATRPSGGSWQARVNLSEEGQSASEPHVAIDALGDAVAIWGRYEIGGDKVVQAAARPTGGSWQTPFNLSEEGQDTTASEVATDQQGDAVAVWQRVSGTNEAIETAFRPAGESWQAPVILNEAYNAFAPEVALDPRGDAVVVWDHIYSSVQAATRLAGGTWQGPVNLEEADQGGVDPQVAVSSQGDAVATWERFDDSRDEIVQAAGYDAAGPLLGGLSIPSTGTAGEPVSFSVSPLSVWSSIAETRWSFGDGSSAVGTSVTHAYAKAGTYEVTLESEDALGNKTTTVGTITIAPRIERAEYKNWVLSGTLTPKKLGQSIRLPEGSTFNGSGELNTETGAGSVKGELFLPPFNTTVKLFGLLPVNLGMTLTEAGTIEGAVAKHQAVSGDETLSAPTALNLRITSVTVLGLGIPTSCVTSEPVGLNLVANLTPEELLTEGWGFTGTMTLPKIKCEGGFAGGLFGELLSGLISGPETAYSVSIRAPGA